MMNAQIFTEEERERTRVGSQHERSKFSAQYWCAPTSLRAEGQRGREGGRGAG